MHKKSPSSEPADFKENTNRRSFLEKTLAATGLILFPAVSQSLAQTKSGATPARSPEPHPPAGRMMAATGAAFWDALSADQRAKATFAFEDQQRLDWHFIPRARKGVPFKELDPAQRHLANALLGAGLSSKGFVKAATIMSLETILREVERGSGPARDAELYYITLFGDPRSGKPWGWRAEGHHLSLNFTLLGQDSMATTPFFLGANPAEVQHGSRKGLRTLAVEEDLARTLLKSLDAKQRGQAVVSETAPRDIFSTPNVRKAELLKPAGIPAAQMNRAQKDFLVKLLEEYLNNMPAAVAAARVEMIRSAGIDQLSFAWAGGAEHRQAHYYRIQGPAFLIEYDNIQNDANHIHTVWRDFNGDFGQDLLAAHHKTAHR